MTPEEIDKRMDELVHRLAETHDKKIIKELYELALEREGRQEIRLSSGTEVPDEAYAAK